jgi:hypothetical protein
MSLDQPHEAFVRTCGCARLARRKCDLCLSESLAPYVFTACSIECLQRHQNDAHGVSTASAARAAQYQTIVNRNSRGFGPRYASHTEHLMRVLASVGRGSDLCVLGAGNCTDLDPDQLARDFSKIHLVDLDGEALERGRESFAPSARDRVVTHAAVDLSGFLDRLDEWGERFPDDDALGRSATTAIHALLERIGGTFHVVLSDCILSQLAIPYRQHWLMHDANWSRLFQAVHAVHLATITRSVAPGGHGIIAFDVLGSGSAPALRGIAAGDDEAIELLVREHAALQHGRGREALIREHASLIYQHPARLMKALESPALRSLVASLRLTPPWLWNSSETLVVYGLVWDRP